MSLYELPENFFSNELVFGLYVAIQTVPHVETSGAVYPDGTCKFVAYVAGSATVAVLIAGCATDVEECCEVPDVEWCCEVEPDV